MKRTLYSHWEHMVSFSKTKRSRPPRCWPRRRISVAHLQRVSSCWWGDNAPTITILQQKRMPLSFTGPSINLREDQMEQSRRSIVIRRFLQVIRLLHLQRQLYLQKSIATALLFLFCVIRQPASSASAE